MQGREDNNLLNVLSDLAETATVAWWKFFDWLAVVSWGYLLIA